jgi:hypothetical protein
MRTPIMLRPETNVAVLVLALVKIPQGVPTGLGLFLIEPTARKNSTSGFDPHHRYTGAAVLNQRCAFEAGLDPVINVALCFADPDLIELGN